ncbi:MAG: hypothetical protein AAGC84_14720, partial [Pseudomonas sp.]
MKQIERTPRLIAIIGGDDRVGANMTNLLNEGRSSRLLRRLMLGVVALVVMFVLWSLLARVDELAKARGEIQPVARTQLLQSKEGGILAELLVRADEHVKAGQVIARFAAVDIEKEHTQALVRRAGLQIDRELWSAIAEQREPDFSGFVEQPDLVAEATGRFATERQFNTSQLTSKSNALEQHKEELNGARAELPEIQRQVHLARESAAHYQDGFDRAVISAVRLAESQEHVAQVKRSLAQAQSRLVELQKQVATAESELKQTQDEITQKAGALRAGLLEKIRELDAEMSALEDRHGRIEVIAPVAGYIKQLPDTREGAVIATG